MHSSLTNKIMLADPSNYTVGRQGYKVCKITPHHMAAIWTAERCAQSFQDPNRNASANYCIGNDGTIICNVDEVNRAWTSSNGVNDCQAITIEVANSTGAPDWKVSDAAWNSLVKLCADICKRYGFRLNFTGNANGSLTMHKMFAATACPGPYLEPRMGQLAKEVNALLDGGASQPNTSGELYRVRKSWSDSKTQLGAFKVLDNAKKLVDQNPSYKVFNSAGKQVYPTQQAATPAPAKKTVAEIAKEVIAGKWGNGQDRVNKLTAAGYDANAVQAEVNKQLGAGSTKKSNEEIAREVIAGKWGNGTDRKNRLTQAGYDYNAIQALVNQML